MKTTLLAIATLVTVTGSVGALSVESPSDRRAFLGGAAVSFGVALGTSFPSEASAAYRLGDPKSVIGKEIRSFNALINEFEVSLAFCLATHGLG
jgi:hypothetical protein